jgi:hypothetical protein
MAAPTYPIRRCDVPTIYFIGVTTGRSSVNALFPRRAARPCRFAIDAGQRER